MDSPEPRTVNTVTRQESGPPAYAQPFIEEFLGGAQERYQSDAPEFFPGDTFVPFSPQTEQALTGIEGAAAGGSPIGQAGADEYLKTVQGGYLTPESNPFLQSTIDAAIRPAVRAYTEEVMPNIASQFSLAGRYGSDAQKDTLDRSLDTLGRSLGETGANIAYANYGDERGRQFGATQGAPDYALRRFDDMNQLLGVGTQREGLAGRELQDKIARFDFGQNQPQIKLGEYGGNIRQGVFGGSGTQTGQTPYFPGNPLLGAVGAGTSLAGAAGALGAKPFGK